MSSPLRTTPSSSIDRFDDENANIDAQNAARAVVAAQSYAMGGGKSATVNFLHAPLVGKAMVLIKGNDLFETLSLNLLPMGSSSPIALNAQASKEQLALDRPIWEAEKLDRPGSSRPVLGYLDLLTWQSRAINLLRSSDGPASFNSMYMAQGTVMQSETLFDPMVAYRLTKENGWRPIGLEEEERAVEEHGGLGPHDRDEQRFQEHRLRFRACI